jgi:hypothetical protein
MFSNAISFIPPKGPAETNVSPVLEENAPILDRKLALDYSFVFSARECQIEFALHRLVRSYSVYGRLFAVKN